MTVKEREQFSIMQDAMATLTASSVKLAEANIELTVRLKSIHAQLCKINRALIDKETIT